MLQLLMINCVEADEYWLGEAGAESGLSEKWWEVCI
jgi:hypothetical protein